MFSIESMKKELRAKIDELGWVVIETETEKGLTFAYTIGVSSFYGTEIGVAGMPSGQSSSFLNDIAQKMFEGDSLQEGRTFKVRGRNVQLLKMNDKKGRTLMGLGLLVLGSEFEKANLVQLAWANAEGFFPWEKECDLKTKTRQPIMSRENH